MPETPTSLPSEKMVAKHSGERTVSIQRLVPQSFAELTTLANTLAKSDIVPKDMIGKPANVLLALMFGNEIGLSPAQALQNVMVVNGRPSLWGDAVMGLVLASDVYEDSRDSFDEKTQTATFEAKRKGKDWVVRTFSMADAKLAGLDRKAGPWQQYPKRMLFHRARSWALRDTFADVLKGVRYYEEERDVVDLQASRGADGAKVYEVPKMTPKATDAETVPLDKPAPSAEQPTSPEPAAAENGAGDKVATADERTKGLIERVAATTLGAKEATAIRFKGDDDAYYTDDKKVAEYAEKAKKEGAYVLYDYDTVAGKKWLRTLERAKA